MECSASLTLSSGDSIFKAQSSTLSNLAAAVEELRQRVPHAARLGFKAAVKVQPSGKSAWFVELVYWSQRNCVCYISVFQMVSQVRCSESLIGNSRLFSPAIFHDGTVDQNGDTTLRDGSNLYGASFEYDRRARPRLTESQKGIIRAVRAYLRLPGGVLSVTESDRQIDVISATKLAELRAGVVAIVNKDVSEETIRRALIEAGLRFPESRAPRSLKNRGDTLPAIPDGPA